MGDDYGVERVRTDGLDIKERRLPMNLFASPPRLPVGTARQQLSDREYVQQAEPVYKHAADLERAVHGLFDDERRAPRAIDGQVMWGVITNTNHKGSDDFGVARTVSEASKEEAARRQAEHQRRSPPYAHLAPTPPAAPDSRPASNIVGRRCYAQSDYVPSAAMIGSGQYGYSCAAGPAGSQQTSPRGAQDPSELDQQVAARMAARIAAQTAEETSLYRTRMLSSQIFGQGSHAAPAPKATFEDRASGSPHGAWSQHHGNRSTDYNFLVRDDLRAPPPPPRAHAGLTSKSTNPTYHHEQPPEILPGYFQGVSHLQKRTSEHVGKRNDSSRVEFDVQQPVPLQPGYYYAPDQSQKRNEHAGKMTASRGDEFLSFENVERNAGLTVDQHQRARARKPEIAVRANYVEKAVFNHALIPEEHERHPPPPTPPIRGMGMVSGQKATQTQMQEVLFAGGGGGGSPGNDVGVGIRRGPVPNARAADTVMPGLLRSSGEPSRQPPTISKYDSLKSPRGADLAINGPQVPPDAPSALPMYIPKKHPGPTNLQHQRQRGMGIDGKGHDHMGRQLATSLVDEVVYGRSPLRGKLYIQNHGANFNVGQDGNFGKR